MASFLRLVLVLVLGVLAAAVQAQDASSSKPGYPACAVRFSSLVFE